MYNKIIMCRDESTSSSQQSPGFSAIAFKLKLQITYSFLLRSPCCSHLWIGSTGCCFSLIFCLPQLYYKSIPLLCTLHYILKKFNQMHELVFDIFFILFHLLCLSLFLFRSDSFSCAMFCSRCCRCHRRRRCCIRREESQHFNFKWSDAY